MVTKILWIGFSLTAAAMCGLSLPYVFGISWWVGLVLLIFNLLCAGARMYLMWNPSDKHPT